MFRIKINDILEGKSSAEYPTVILTTYNTAVSTAEDKNFTKKIPFNYVVFDEAHMLKNCFTQRFEHLMKIKVCVFSSNNLAFKLTSVEFFPQAKRRILLTGTPMQNSLKELMSLLIFVMPKMFESHRHQLLKTFTMYPVISNNTPST